MEEMHILKAALGNYLSINAARLHFLAGIILAIIKVRTVNFAEIAVAFPGKVKKESKYKRIQRFFRFFPLDLGMVARLVVELIDIKNDFWILTMDRTNWKFGVININILMIGIAFKGIAFPIVWILLPKKGNSNTKERIRVVEKFVEIFGTSRIKSLTGDREFIGHEWFSYLLKTLNNFRMRIKENSLVSNSRGKLVPVKNLFKHLKPGHWHVLNSKRTVMGHHLFIVGLKMPNGEFVILATAKEPEAALDEYKQRWEIETVFGCLKTRGFRFESTHLRDPARISKLVAVLAIAFAWCHVIGELQNDENPIKIKKHGRRAISIFRYGLDTLREVLLNIDKNISNFRQMVEHMVSRISVNSSSADPPRLPP